MEERAEYEPGVQKRTLFQLTRNYRMNEPLTAYPRETIYGTYEAASPKRRIEVLPGGATSGDGAVAGETQLKTGRLIELVTDPSRPVVLAWYAPPRSFTARNPLEAEVAAEIVAALSKRLVNPRTGSLYAPKDLADNGVAVVAPHRAQNATIHSALMQRGFGPGQRPMPLVDTVEKLQGKQREVIVVSYGVADAEYVDAEADFLLSRNRFNVAATRSQAKLIVLCSDVVLEAVPDEQRVLLESMMIKEFRTYCQDGVREVAVRHPDFGAVPFVVQWKAFSA